MYNGYHAQHIKAQPTVFVQNRFIPTFPFEKAQLYCNLYGTAHGVLRLQEDVMPTPLDVSSKNTQPFAKALSNETV